MAILGHAVNSLILGLWLHISINDWKFIWTEWLYWSVGTFFAIVIMGFLADRNREKGSARDTIKPESEDS